MISDNFAALTPNGSWKGASTSTRNIAQSHVDQKIIKTEIIFNSWRWHCRRCCSIHCPWLEVNSCLYQMATWLIFINLWYLTSQSVDRRGSEEFSYFFFLCSKGCRSCGESRKDIFFPLEITISKSNIQKWHLDILSMGRFFWECSRFRKQFNLIAGWVNFCHFALVLLWGIN